jgi:hypothetical protein
VPVQDFFFALDIMGAPAKKSMLEELLSRVLERAGCAGEMAPGLLEGIQAALVKGSRGREACRLQFHTRDAQLHIVVSSRAGEIWHTTCASTTR